jgi:heme-degrading monooxygenase HmoA
LINVFEIPRDEIDAFIEGWAERAQIMSTYPGFRDSRLHRALSPHGRFQLVNVAHWDTPGDYEAARTDPAFQQSRMRLAEQTPNVVSNVDLYRVAASRGL